MLNKLKTLREEREDGFTLIELLVVILIIGILASIAIPVFLNQRKTANDGAVEADVRNAATAIETWIVDQGGQDTAIPAAAYADVKASTEVKLAIRGTANNYCIIGSHSNGKKYSGNLTNRNVLTYENALGGLGKGGGAGATYVGACAGTTGWLAIN